MSKAVVALPSPTTRETIKLLREIAKQLERGEHPPLLFASAIPAKDGSGDTTIDARAHNITPAGMLVTITYFLKLVRERASRTLGNETDEHRAAEAKAILMANAALFSLKQYDSEAT
jgi:hypothetical protein